MIKKYNEVDMKIQSSRKIIILKLMPIIIAAVIILGIVFNTETEGGLTLGNALKMITLLILIFSLDLYKTDWSIKIEDNMLFARKWIFKYEIPLNNLISIREYSNNPVDSIVRYESLIIEYKKENNIKHLKIRYLTKSPYMKIEYAKKSEISELKKIFINQMELKETNILDTNYKEIRTEKEENEFVDFIKKKKNSEEKLIWIILFTVIIVPVVFFSFVFMQAF